jgi:hypothetical protein
VCPYRLSTIFKDLLFKSNSHTVKTFKKLWAIKINIYTQMQKIYFILLC